MENIKKEEVVEKESYYLFEEAKIRKLLKDYGASEEETKNFIEDMRKTLVDKTEGIDKIVKKRLDRYEKSLLKKLGCYSIDELIILALQGKREIDMTKLPKRTRPLRAEFENDDINIIKYIIYHDEKVHAVINPDGSLQVCPDPKRKRDYAMFFMYGDDIYNGVVTKTMKMSEFYEKVIEEGYNYIDLANSKDCDISAMPVEYYKDFTKESIDKAIETKEASLLEYAFLKENSIYASNHLDTVVISASLALKLFSQLKDS